MSTPAGFDVEGPLPTGTSVLEASAGTGKTYTIARLVSRYISEGFATMDALLVVSFSEASSQELRDRVRERLVHDRDGAAGLARDRLDRALADFDGATVTTTHGFCYAMLRELGVAADHDHDAVLLEDPSSVVSEVADDLYLRKWGSPGAPQATVTPEEFRELARVVTADPATPLTPRPDETADVAALIRARIAVAIRQEVARRLRARRLITYDDMVQRLDASLRDVNTGEAAIARMRRRFSIVLVDEFQDTDPVQWRIVRTAFHGHATLVLVGDPKQAIYGFRGADVHAYLEARGVATTRATLLQNYRSDSGVLDGLAALFGGAALGDPQISVLPVAAAVSGRMLGTGSPVRLRVVPRDGHTLNTYGYIPTEEARITIREDLAGEVVALLTSGAQLIDRDGAQRAVHPGDIAAVVRSNAEAESIRDRLRAAGVPAVVSGRSSIFDTDAALAWQQLLEALERPHRTTRVRRLAVGPLVGCTAETMTDQNVDGLALLLRLWLRDFAEHGVAGLYGRALADLRLPERLLTRPDGERMLTDLRHLTEVLHEEALRADLGLTTLATWLRRHRTQHDDSTVERSRRLETDAAAVQVLTSHMSKGLEFPVVLAPSLWDHNPRTQAYPRFYDGGTRIRDIGGESGPGHAAHVQANKEEDANEELRLAYVTLTRAAALVIVWWAPTANSASGPLTRLLLHDDPHAVAPWSMPIPADSDVLSRARTRAATSGGALEVAVLSPVSTASPARWTAPEAPAASLELAEFTRAIDQSWRRTSYSALTGSAHAPAPAGVSAHASQSVAADGSDTMQKNDEIDVAYREPAPASDALDPDTHLHTIASRWNDLPSGTGFGTLVHRVLERYEPGADLPTLIASSAFGRGTDVGTLSVALEATLSTPLGPHAGGRSWASLAAIDRLPELGFELPLAGGDRPTGPPAALATFVDLWREHLPDGPLAGYADALAQLVAAGPSTLLRGYLTGSIDAVVRIPKNDGQPAEQYLVVDYKTNRLAPREEPLTAWHYRNSALERAMIDAHYPLQALLYTVALHRYLRWRRPGYQPEQHLGGVLYLFLRGMSGSGVADHTGAAPGVFAWRPPTSLVIEFSNALAGGAR
jgi:exodeoxyribonuclease V beta subunit